MSLFYNVTMHKPTRVLHAALATFLTPSEPCLILNHGTSLSVWSLATALGTETGEVLPLFDVPLFGSVEEMLVVSLKESPGRQGLHLVFSESFSLIAYDARLQRPVTLTSGSLKDLVGCATDTPCMALHTEAGVAVYHRSIGYLRVVSYLIPSAEPLQLPVDRDFITLCCHEGHQPDGSILVSVIAKDARLRRQLLTFSLNLQQPMLRQVPFLCVDNVEGTACMLIPVSLAAGGGVILIGDQFACYVQQNREPITTAFDPEMQAGPSLDWASRTCWTQLDPETFCIGSVSGRAHLLKVKDGVISTRYICCGTAPTAIVPLAEGVFFFGSKFGDSLVIRTSADGQTTITDFLPNIGPVLDMVLADIDRSGRNSLLMCSGALKDASLRVVRSGIAINVTANLGNLPGVRGLWVLSEGGQDRFLVLGFLGGSVVLASTGETFEQITLPGFDHDSPTVAAATLQDASGKPYVLQVTPRGARLLSIGREGGLLDEFSSPGGQDITLASTSSSLTVLAAGPRLCIIEATTTGKLELRAETTRPHDIACIHIATENLGVPIVTVGQWSDHSVSLLSFPGLAELVRTPVSGLPRSCILHRFGETLYLMVGQGQGTLSMWKLATKENALGPSLVDERSYTFGGTAVSLGRYNESCVIVRGASTGVFHHNGRRLILADINMQDIDHVVAFGGQIGVLTNQGDLLLGSMESIQKLHMQTFPLSESPLKVAIHKSSHGVVLLTRRYPNVTYRDGKVRSELIDQIRILDMATFDPQGSYLFDHQGYEIGQALLVTTLGDDATEYILVGTAYARPDEQEAHSGRILVFVVEDSLRSLRVVEELSVKGGVYSLVVLGGRLFAGVGNRVNVYRWGETSDHRKELQQECNGGNCIVPISLAASSRDLLAVGDIVRSVSLMKFNTQSGVLENVAHDYNPMWVSCLCACANDMVCAFDNCNNLAIMRQNKETKIEDDKKKLDTVARYHCAEFVNATAVGSMSTRSVVAEVVEGEVVVMCQHSPVMYAGVNGSLSMLLPISTKLFEFCTLLQNAVLATLQPVGNLRHNEWRAHRNNTRTVPSHGVVDGNIVELFGDLEEAERQRVVDTMNKGVPFGWKEFTVTDVMRKVDDLTRLHH